MQTPVHHDGRPVRRDEDPDHNADWLPDRRDWIDLGGSLRLGAYIGPDGQREYWLIDGSIKVGHLGCGCASCVPHEQLDPPPPSRQTSQPDAPCGRTTLEGNPCQIRTRDGRPCHHHDEDRP